MKVGRERFGDIPDYGIEHGRIRIIKSSGYRRGPGILRHELRGRGEAEHLGRRVNLYLAQSCTCHDMAQLANVPQGERRPRGGSCRRTDVPFERGGQRRVAG